MTDDNLVIVAAYGSSAEAHLAKNALALEGIAASIADEATNDTLWYVGTALKGVKLQVAERDKDQARRVLQTSEATMDCENSPPAKCPHCGAATEPGFDICWSCESALDGQIVASRDMRCAVTSGDVADNVVTRVPADEDVGRAWRSAVFGIIFPPLLLYSLYLIVKVSTKETSNSATRQFFGAVTIALAGCVFWWMLFSRL
jgi:hypothetical protein